VGGLMLPVRREAEGSWACVVYFYSTNDGAQRLIDSDKCIVFILETIKSGSQEPFEGELADRLLKFDLIKFLLLCPPPPLSLLSHFTPLPLFLSSSSFTHPPQVQPISHFLVLVFFD